MSQKLEITAISAEDLRIVRKPVKKKAFVVVKIGGKPNQTARTRIDNDGGANPTWEDKLAMEITPEKALESMSVEVYVKTSAGDWRVGKARVPVKDFVGGHAPEGYLHCLSYRLLDDGGLRNGIVNFSVRVTAAISDC